MIHRWPRAFRRFRRAWLMGGAFVALAGAAGPARAYDAATTHAGLTQKAAFASMLHQVLARRLGRQLGLFDPIRLSIESVRDPERRLLAARLRALDPAGGYRPNADGTGTAIGWLMAGSVLAKTPPERIRNLFFDPSTQKGLADASGVDGFLHSVRQIFDEASLRGVATGAAFSFDGRPALDWVTAKENDLGLMAFATEIEAAVVAPTAAERQTALARALLALGGVLAVLEDSGNPAQVRNDFRRAYLQGPPGSPFDRGSAYERHVADRYGVAGVPAPAVVVRRDDLRAFFVADDGQGLAQRTQRRFFSEGSLPEDGVIDRDTTTADVLRAARGSLTYALPGIPRLDLRDVGGRHYVTVLEPVAEPQGEAGARAGAGTNKAKPRRVLGYVRVPGRVRFFLDEAVHADTAAAVLPEIAGYAAGLINHLFRAEVAIALASGASDAAAAGARDDEQRPAGSGGQVRVELRGARGTLKAGARIHLVAEDAAGRRREIGGAHGLVAGQALSVAVPTDARRISAVVSGDDDAGPLVALGELRIDSPSPVAVGAVPTAAVRPAAHHRP